MGDSNRHKVHVVNNDGAGFAREIDVVPGTTCEQLVKTLVTANPEKYNIHVNRDNVSSGYVMRNGDRLVITPKKIAGANFREKTYKVNVLRYRES